MKAAKSQPIRHMLGCMAAACMVGISQESQAASLLQIPTFDLQQGSNDLTFHRFQPAPDTRFSVTTFIRPARSGCDPGVGDKGASTPTIRLRCPKDMIVDDEHQVLDWSNVAGDARLITASTPRPTSHSSVITVGADTDDSPGYVGFACDLCDVPEAAHHSYASFGPIAIQIDMFDPYDLEPRKQKMDLLRLE